MADDDGRRPCPCCGHLVFHVEDGWPRSYAICDICFWEDDGVQFRWPFRPGGANRPSLYEAQRNYLAYGACDQRGRKYVRPPTEDEPLDQAWRPIDLDVDFFEKFSDSKRPWPDDPARLCWWLPEFWGQPEDPPPPPRLAIDLADVQDERQLHTVLKRDLNFPDFYGMNWPALWDAITGLVELPAELAFAGWTAFERRCPEAAAMLRSQFDRYAETHNGFTARYH
ncbi:CPCC family cysteine-rich protein [Kutzneria sp. NPDC051319]|uniref:CPCC family cysteine-rich protein n=1 Tax=Kutzneria sp. NPDC051319 TaxID=3155047 RepID=UPI003423F926